MTPFENYVLDSARQNAFNLSKSKDKPKFITVYVEGIEDKSFWFHILSPHIKPLEFRCFSNDSLRTGKKGLTKHFDNTGKWLIVCLDSDYDYLFQKTKITQNIGIFQTYAYAIENLKCYAESLIGVCADVTHNPTEKINFIDFLEEYSKTIYDLFMWHLYFYSLFNESEFSAKDFGKIIKISEKINLNSIDKLAFAPLNNRINKKINELTQKFPEKIEKVKDFAEKLSISGLESKNTYLFIQGHILYDNVVLPLLRVVCNSLKTDSIKEINQSSAKPDHKNKVRDDYLKSIGNPSKEDDGGGENEDKDEKIDRMKLVLSLNKNFENCFLFQKIITDIKFFKQQTQGLMHV